MSAHAQRIKTLKTLLHWNLNHIGISIVKTQRIDLNFGYIIVRTLSARNDASTLKIGLSNPL